MRLAAIVGGLALARQHGLAIVAPGAPKPQARFAGLGQLPVLLEHLLALPVVTDAPGAEAALALHGDTMGRVHWISDFSPPRHFALPLTALRRRGARVTGWLPTVPEDVAPTTTGYLRVVDPENGVELTVPVDPSLRRELRQQLAALARHQQRLFAEAGCPLRRWPVPDAAEPRLEHYLPIVAAATR
jgi:hypothetical protein